MNLIASTIREYRSRTGASQRELSKLIGISQAQLWQLESGCDLPSLPSLQAIARFFQITPDRIGAFVLSADIPARKDSLLSRPGKRERRPRIRKAS